MCYKIEAPFVLMHILNIKKSVSTKELSAVKREVEKEFPDAYVDISKNMLLCTVTHYPEIFIWEGEYTIRRKDGSDKFFNESVIGYFNNVVGMGNELEAKIIQCIKEAVNKLGRG